MRIAFVIDTLYPWELGGAHKRVWEIGRRLAGDHDVHVFGMKYWEGSPVIEQDGMTYHGVCEERELYKDGTRSLTQPLVYSASLIRPLFETDFDVIDCQKSSYFHFFPSKLRTFRRDTALVGTFNEVWGDYWYDYIGRKGFFGKKIENFTIGLPDEVITISNRNKRELIGMGRSEPSISVIPDGIGFNEIDAVSPSEAAFDVLYAGRLAAHKNVDLLLDAIAYLHSEMDQPVTCGIVGKGPEMESLKQQVSALGINDSVEFFGFLEDIDDVYGYMKSAGVFVLPSQREGAGLVTLEANACGTPSITTQHKHNAATEVVEDDVNGYICGLDKKDLARTIQRGIERSDALAEGCREYAKKYEWDNIVTDTVDVYEKAMR